MKKLYMTAVLAVMIVISGCRSKDVISFHQTDGESFLYNSPITSVCDGGECLLLGTSRGDVISFDLSDGSFSRLFKDPYQRLVYHITQLGDGSYMYSVQNGGIIHRSSDDSIKEYMISPEKGSNYSSYRFIYEDEQLYAATSNGVYHWMPSSEYGERLDTKFHEDPDDVVESRFYSIERRDSYGDMICSGRPGHFCIDVDGRSEHLESMPLNASHDGISLTSDGGIYVDGEHLTSLDIDALDFECDGTYIYAVSHSSLEIISLSDGGHVKTIRLPEGKSLEKNASCRSICLIKDKYLYLAPGGCSLYRMPLYGYSSNSKEVIQVCGIGTSTAYLLTSANDLYRYDLNDGDLDYRRSFEPSEDVKLISGYNGRLVVSIDGTYYELTGKRMTTEKRLSDLNGLNKSKVLWHLTDGNVLYQGQVDKIRAYDGSEGWKSVKEYERDSCMNNGTLSEEYYPQYASMYGDYLLVHTMHNGSYVLNTDNERFSKIEKFDGLTIKGITGEDNAIYVLTDDGVVMNTITKDTLTVPFSNPAYEHMTDIIAISDNSFMTYSAYNRWCKGLVIYSEGGGGKWIASSYLQPHTINAITRIGDSIVAVGTMGLTFISQDGVSRCVPVPAPTFFEKNVLAWNYPWGIVIYVAVIAIGLAAIIWCVIIVRRRYLRYRRNMIAHNFMTWVENEYKGKYITSMARQLVLASPDRKTLGDNIRLFKGCSSELSRLNKFIDTVVEFYNDVKSLKAMDIENSKNADKIKELKTTLDSFSCPDHPFGNTIISSWGKTTKQPVRTMMLLPLKFKIKFMQVFDSRTGTEKMEFKAFMDKNKSSVRARKLEIRDLIALSAYEAIKSEKATTDA
ncbi:MAG: hypothetical protein E7115_08815 [Bacteroidales bacterium]|nr:hypothetical protein [Bacteroidales bacterium]